MSYKNNETLITVYVDIDRKTANEINCPSIQMENSIYVFLVIYGSA